MIQVFFVIALAVIMLLWAAVIVAGPRTPEEREYEDSVQWEYLTKLSKNKQRK